MKIVYWFTVSNMKNLIISILLVLSFLPVFSEEDLENNSKKVNIPATDFIKSGIKLSLAGTGKSSHSHSGGEKHLYDLSFFNYIFKNQGQLFNLNSGQLQRDNILYENVENYSYLNQPYQKVSPLGKASLSYTSKSGEWTFEVSGRAQNYSGNYVLGNNQPYEYYPGQMLYSWREGQYSIIRNHAIFSFLMVQPQIGVREIREDYERKSDLFSYPAGKNYSYLHEYSQTYSQQAGLSFYFKLIGDLKFKLTGKIFQPIQGNLHFNRNDIRYDGTNYYIRNMQSKTNRVSAGGNELEGEFSYSVSRFNFFFGYNLTTILKEARKDPNYLPTIMTNENLQFEYLKYIAANALLQTNYFGSGEASGSGVPRTQTVKYLYFGISVNF